MVNHRGNTPLIQSIKSKREPQVIELLNNSEVDVNLPD